MQLCRVVRITHFQNYNVVFYCELLTSIGYRYVKWGTRRACNDFSLNEKHGFIYCILFWELRGSRGNVEKRRCLLSTGEESDSHLLMKYSETQRWREELLKSEWPHINEEIAIRKILTNKSGTKQRNLGTFAHNIKCKCENQA